MPGWDDENRGSNGWKNASWQDEHRGSNAWDNASWQHEPRGSNGWNNVSWQDKGPTTVVWPALRGGGVNKNSTAAGAQDDGSSSWDKQQQITWPKDVHATFHPRKFSESRHSRQNSKSFGNSQNNGVSQSPQSNGGVALHQQRQHQWKDRGRAPPRGSNRGRQPQGNGMQPRLVPAQVQNCQFQEEVDVKRGEVNSQHLKDQEAPQYQPEKPKRQSNWPTKAECTPKPQPSSDGEQAEEDGNEDADVASVQADAGHGQGTKNKPPKQPAVDMSLGIRDWDGGWAPVPEVWEGRPMYSDGFFAEKVAQWHDGYDPAVTTSAVMPFTDDFREIPFRHATIPETLEFSQSKGEICPHDWVIEEIDSDPTKQRANTFAAFWADMQKQAKADELAEIDDNIKPYWERYTGWNHDQLTALQMPDPKIDPGDNDLSVAQRQTSELSSSQRANAHLRRINKGKKLRRDAIRSQREMENYVPPPNKYSPSVNMYLRPMEMGDAPAILAIYNYWVQHSIFAPEKEPIPLSSIQDRMEDSVTDLLPWLVAVDRSQSKNLARGPRQRQNRQGEHIIGFAFADDYHSRDTMYRYTVEAECFVHPNYTRKGVGRTLMDKLISVLDGGYIPVGGYEFLCADNLLRNNYENGGQRTLDKIYINIPFDADDHSKLEWNSDWLERRWGFKQKGLLDDIGRKLNTKVSVAIYARNTKATIDKTGLLG